MEPEIIIKEAIKIIRKYLSPDYKFFLFSSWAKGGALPTSDIDWVFCAKERLIGI